MRKSITRDTYIGVQEAIKLARAAYREAMSQESWIAGKLTTDHTEVAGVIDRVLDATANRGESAATLLRNLGIKVQRRSPGRTEGEQ